MSTINSLKGKKVLFFGIKNCKNSINALEHLESKGCLVKSVLGSKRGDKLPLEAFSWEGDYIFSYRCYWLIPKNLIQKAKLMALNFHPALPDYPGSGAYSWAIYHNAEEFGITIHLMNEKFDSGKILEIYKFKLSEDIDVHDLIDRSYDFSLIAFKKFINNINNKSNEEINDLKNIKSLFKWKGEAKKLSELDKMRNIDFDITKNELNKRIKAFHFKEYPITINLNGFKFELCLKEKTNS